MNLAKKLVDHPKWFPRGEQRILILVLIRILILFHPGRIVVRPVLIQNQIEYFFLADSIKYFRVSIFGHIYAHQF